MSQRPRGRIKAPHLAVSYKRTVVDEACWLGPGVQLRVEALLDVAFYYWLADRRASNRRKTDAAASSKSSIIELQFPGLHPNRPTLWTSYLLILFDPCLIGGRGGVHG